MADIRELPQIEYDENYDPYYEYFLREKQMGEEPESEEKVKTLDIEKGFDQDEIKIIEEYGFVRPIDISNLDSEDLTRSVETLKDVLKSINGNINGRKNKKNPSKSFIDETKSLISDKDTLKNIKKQLKIIDHHFSIKKGRVLCHTSPPKK